jgi:hypothetical protein
MWTTTFKSVSARIRLSETGIPGFNQTGLPALSDLHAGVLKLNPGFSPVKASRRVLQWPYGQRLP